jgi:DNA-binding CsgD family transcriptional regulator
MAAGDVPSIGSRLAPEEKRRPLWRSPLRAAGSCGPTGPVQGLLERFSEEQSLSTRERAVLDLTLQELHTKEIASRLGCAPSTINEYWKRIYRKTGAGSKVAVLSRLLLRGLL